MADTDMQSSESCPHWQKYVAPPLASHGVCDNISLDSAFTPAHTSSPRKPTLGTRLPKKEVSREFTFTLTPDETARMFVGNTLKKGWADIFCGAFCRSSADSRCVLSVRYRHVKKAGSKKKHTPFFTCYAHCRIPKCHMFKFTVQEAPITDGAVVLCEQYGASHASHGEYHAHRYLRGERRARVAQEVEKQGPYLVRQEMAKNAPHDQLADGNLTEAPPTHVTSQAAYESRKAERFSADWAEDLQRRMEDSAAADTESKALLGGIHLTGRVPLIVHMYREHFFKKYHGQQLSTLTRLEVW